MFPSSNKTLTFLPYEDPEVFLVFLDFTVAKGKNAIQRNVKRGQTGSKQPRLDTKHFTSGALCYQKILCVFTHLFWLPSVFSQVFPRIHYQNHSTEAPRQVYSKVWILVRWSLSCSFVQWICLLLPLNTTKAGVAWKYSEHIFGGSNMSQCYCFIYSINVKASSRPTGFCSLDCLLWGCNLSQALWRR